jgi:phosphatidate cytidylyltransferase
MKVRTLTAIVFAAIMIAIPLTGSIPTCLLYIIIGSGCGYELAKLYASPSISTSISASILPLIVSYIMYATDYFSESKTIGILMLISLFFILLSFQFFKKTNEAILTTSITSASFLYVGVPIGMVPLLLYADAVYSPTYLLGMLFLIWSNDSFAYLIGSTLGRNKIFSKISPNKTLEGYLGGLIMTGILAYLVSSQFFENQVVLWTGLGLICAIFGSAGDLFESLLKRNAGVKDTGTFLPGHGGWLDRFDAMIFALPFGTFWIYLMT